VVYRGLVSGEYCMSGIEQKWMFRNEHKILFMLLREKDCVGYVIETVKRPFVQIARVATEEDMLTVQYTEARRLT
jgi:hypothetical protein